MKTKFAVLFTIVFVSFLVSDFGFAATTSPGPVYRGGGGYEQTPCSRFFEYYWKARMWGINVAEQSNGFYTGEPAPWAIRSVVSQWQLEGLVDKNFDAGIIDFIFNNFGIYPASVGFILMQTGLTFPEFQGMLDLLPDKNWVRPLAAVEVEVLLAKAAEILAAKVEVPLLIKKDGLIYPYTRIGGKILDSALSIDFRQIAGLESAVTGSFGITIDGELPPQSNLQWWADGAEHKLPLLPKGEDESYETGTASFNLAEGMPYILAPSVLTKCTINLSFQGKVTWYSEIREVTQTVTVRYEVRPRATITLTGDKLTIISSTSTIVTGGNFSLENQPADRIVNVVVYIGNEHYELQARSIYGNDDNGAIYYFNFGRIPIIPADTETVISISVMGMKNPWLIIEAFDGTQLDTELIYP